MRLRNADQIAYERSQINQAVRSFFCSRGYLEIETPLLVRSPGMEPNLTPFETVVCKPNGEVLEAALITSPEYAMKKLLGAGFQKIFTITKVFRNEEMLGGQHNPEFTMLEWYEQGADYQAGMTQIEQMIRAAAEALGASLQEKPFGRMRMRDVFLRHTGIDLDIATTEDLKTACLAHAIHFSDDDSASDLFYRLFLSRVEPKISSEPLFLYDYPKYQASLSHLTPDGRYGQRAEMYMHRLEICNGFTELTDAHEQRARFEQEAQERKAGGKRVFPIDEELLKLLPSLRNPTFGFALGIDRLHMALTNTTNIEDVILFPASRLFAYPRPLCLPPTTSKKEPS